MEKFLLVSLFVLLLSVSAVSADTASSVRKSIVVDGDIGDWSGLTGYSVAESSPTKTPPASSDLSGSFKTAWDGEYLYFLFEVVDDEYDVDGGSYIWEQDSVEIMIDGGNEKATSYDSNDHKIVVRADGLNAKVWDGSVNDVVGDDVVASAQQTSDGYLLEVGVRWSFIGGQAPGDGVVYGFDAALNDRDAETYAHYLMWRYADNHPDDTSAWHSLQLSGTAGTASSVSFSPSPLDFTSSSSQVLSVGVSDTVVFDTGFYSVDGGVDWTQFSFSGGSSVGSWFLSSASSSLSLTLSEVNVSGGELVAFYACAWNDAWDCHGGDWQIREFSVSLPSGGSSGTSNDTGSMCGNDIVESGEECDGSNLSGESCTSQGFDGGTLGCSSCSFDTTECFTVSEVCGDGVIEGGEECEPGNLSGESCTSQGFDGGTLSCDSSTCQFDTSSCTLETSGVDSLQGDYDALLALYDSTNGGSWINNGGWGGSADTMGSWYGITTDANGRVTRIALGSNNLDGTLPQEIGNLKKVTYMNIEQNKMTGEIPPQIGDMVSLKELWLAGRVDNTPDFSDGGYHPGKSDTITNRFSGQFPPELGRLRNLEILRWERQPVSGPLPPEIGNLTSLRALLLHGLNNDYSTGFSGQMPPEIGNLKELVFLEFSNQNFEGDLPAEMANLVNLMDLRMGGQGIRSLPPIVNSTKLVRIECSRCTLDMPFPKYFWNGEFTDLNTWRFDRPQYADGERAPGLRGDISDIDFSTTPRMVSFSISENNLVTGTVPQSMTTWNPKIVNFAWTDGDDSIKGGGLKGQLPETGWSDWGKLRNARFNDNFLNGTIPVQLAVQPASRLKHFQRNKYTFAGIIPALEAGAETAGGDFVYAPQKKFGNGTRYYTLSSGDSITLDDFAGLTPHPDNEYQWLRWDQGEIALKDGSKYSGTNTEVLTINNFDPVTDDGSYWLRVNNPRVPDLTLDSHSIVVDN